MAKKFEILESALVITDTITGEYKDFPKRDTYYSSKDLIDGKIKMYDTNGVNAKGSYVYQCDLSEAVDSNGEPFSESNFVSFVRVNMGFNTASGGSGAGGDTQTISWSRSSPSVAINTILQHNDIGVSQVGVPIIYNGFIKEFGYSTRGTKDGSDYTYANWGIRFDIIIAVGGADTYTEYLSGDNSAGFHTVSTPITLNVGDEIWCYVVNGNGAAITSISYPVIEVVTKQNI